MSQVSCDENRKWSGGNMFLIRTITDQNKLRKAKQEDVVVKDKPKLESEYMEKCKRP